MDVLAGKKSKEMLDYLLRRRSVKAVNMSEPAPSHEQMNVILRAAMRVPDHGKTAPFYFLVFEGGARQKAGDIIAGVFQKNNPDAGDKKIEEEAQRFLRAPLVVAVIYRARKAKHPLWEQIMSVGAACQNLILSANALGFGAQWLSEWYAYDDHFRKELGLDNRDVVAGFIHLGTPDKFEEERERPELEELVTYWQPEVEVKKGDGQYDREKFALPDLGFVIRDNE